MVTALIRTDSVTIPLLAILSSFNRIGRALKNPTAALAAYRTAHFGLGRSTWKLFMTAAAQHEEAGQSIWEVGSRHAVTLFLPPARRYEPAPAPAWKRKAVYL